MGTVAYEIKEKILEIFRLSVDKKLRQKGTAAELIARIVEVARKQGCDVVTATTTSPQESAVSFYLRNNWQEVKREPFLGFFIFGVEIVYFQKPVPSAGSS